jgi:YrbI family 3-deoxy-D-manno-octulosonate 8-phosphate phosphatase
MPLHALLDASSDQLQADLDAPVDLTRTLVGKPLWRWAFDAIRDSGAFERIHVRSHVAAILEQARALGAIPNHADHDERPQERPLVRVDVGGVLLTPQDIHQFLKTASPGGTLVDAETASGALLPLLSAVVADDELDVMDIKVPDRIEAARLLFNDWDILETMVRRHGYRRGERKQIRLLVSDVDGVMTDAGFYYDRGGQSLKKFSTRDGMGIVLIRDRIELGIITGEASGFAETRFGNLKLPRIKTGTLDKLPVLDAWRQEMGLDWEEVAYIGDDLPDIPCMQAAGIAACPSDAEPEVKAAADFVSTRRGGHGAVRDFINHLLAHNLVPEKKPTT